MHQKGGGGGVGGLYPPQTDKTNEKGKSLTDDWKMTKRNKKGIYQGRDDISDII